jgi:DNA-binding response OmpR family regulator
MKRDGKLTMRILILEDEPLIAMDLEDIVLHETGASCVWATSVREGLRRIDEGVDFALLDYNLGRDHVTSLPVASALLEKSIPFCFVSGSLSTLPRRFLAIPKIAKPFRPADIRRVLKPH